MLLQLVAHPVEMVVDLVEELAAEVHVLEDVRDAVGYLLVRFVEVLDLEVVGVDAAQPFLVARVDVVGLDSLEALQEELSLFLREPRDFFAADGLQDAEDLLRRLQEFVPVLASLGEPLAALPPEVRHIRTMDGGGVAQGHHFVQHLADEGGFTHHLVQHLFHVRAGGGEDEVLHLVDDVVDAREFLMGPCVGEDVEPHAEPEGIDRVVEGRGQQPFLELFRELAVLLADELFLLGLALEPRQEVEGDPDLAVALAADVAPYILAGVADMDALRHVPLFLLVGEGRGVEVVVHELRGVGDEIGVLAAEFRPTRQDIDRTKVKIDIHSAPHSCKSPARGGPLRAYRLINQFIIPQTFQPSKTPRDALPKRRRPCSGGRCRSSRRASPGPPRSENENRRLRAQCDSY